ncbi:MAG: hypothetical protein PHG16_08030 [Lachnospiraceae bacterium]|nr:hypothetical protein [Lachnospiraceae bacterium]
MKRKITDLSVRFSENFILNMIDCTPDSPIYETAMQELKELEDRAYSLIRPRAVAAWGEIDREASSDGIPEGTKALFTIATLGKEISEWSSCLFREGDYLGGMLVNAMADEALFQVDTAVQQAVIEMSRSMNMGVKQRVEAPNDIEMVSQRLAWEVTEAKEEIGVGIRSSYMLDPLKTNCVIYLLDRFCSEYRTAHNCKNCKAVHCKRRMAE